MYICTTICSLSLCKSIYRKNIFLIQEHLFKGIGPILLSVKNLRRYLSHDSYSQQQRSLINTVAPFSHALSNRISTMPILSPKYFNQFMDV